MHGSPDLRKETELFELSYRGKAEGGRGEVRLRSKSGGRNFSRHTYFNLLSATGDIIGARPITPEIARFIFANFELRGDTASFDIYEKDLASTNIHERREAETAPQSVRHQITTEEHSFTATGAKLARHLPIFEKYRDTGYGSLIRATMTLHQVCASNCPYCSTILRNRKDSISLDEAKAFVMTLYDDQARFNRAQFSAYNDRYKARTGSDIRLRGLILSGGGQPNLWPHFEEFVGWLGGLEIDLGLITNGFPEKISEDIYERFKWIRVSITPEDASPHYVDGRFDRQYIPARIKHNPDLTAGYSYVFGSWTDDDVLRRIEASIAANGFDYCRVLADCNLTRNAQIKAHRALAERLYRLGMVDGAGKPLGRVFHQLKYHGTPDEALDIWTEGQCYVQTYNVFWDTTGHEADGQSFCYPCDSVTVLAEDAGDQSVNVSERRFNPDKWGLVPNTEIGRLFREKVKPYFDPRENCRACLFMRNNRTVKDLASGSRPAANGSTASIAANIAHVNFP